MLKWSFRPPLTQLPATPGLRADAARSSRTPLEKRRSSLQRSAPPALHPADGRKHRPTVRTALEAKPVTGPLGCSSRLRELGGLRLRNEWFNRRWSFARLSGLGSLGLRDKRPARRLGFGHLHGQ